MPKFYVHRMERVSVYAEIEAETEDAAITLFDQHYSGLDAFIGNGGTNKLVGVSPCHDVDYGVESIDDQMPTEAEKIV